jgi:hypothetical protein
MFTYTRVYPTTKGGQDWLRRDPLRLKPLRSAERGDDSVRLPLRRNLYRVSFLRWYDWRLSILEVASKLQGRQLRALRLDRAGGYMQTEPAGTRRR